MIPNYQQLRRDLGRTAAVIVNQAERGTLFDYIEQHKVPTWERPRSKYLWLDVPKVTEAELEDNTPFPTMYEIYVNYEFYGVTKRLDLDYICAIYPYFRQVAKREKVDIFDQWTELLVSSNHIKIEDNDTE